MLNTCFAIPEIANIMLSNFFLLETFIKRTFDKRFFVSLQCRKPKTKNKMQSNNTTTTNQAAASYVAYYRVSTKKQGLGLEAQQANVQAFISQQGAALVAEFSEKESGKRSDRPKLDEALQLCKQTGAVLLVAKLDRLSRNVSFIFSLRDSGVKFQALDLPEFNTLSLGIFASMAQHERELISSRTKAALQALKQKGVKLGAPAATWNDSQRVASVEARRAAAAANEANRTAWGVVRSIRKNVPSITLAALAQTLNENGLLTAKGGSWRGNQVKRLIELFDK